MSADSLTWHRVPGGGYVAETPGRSYLVRRAYGAWVMETFATREDAEYRVSTLTGGMTARTMAEGKRLAGEHHRLASRAASPGA